MAQGEQLHITTWPAVWPTRRPSNAPTSTGKQYDNIAANRTRTAAHCFEAKCFGVMCSGFMDTDMKETLLKTHPSAAETLQSLTQGASMFLDPTGAQVGDMVQGEEGIAYAEMDLSECVEPKQFHDVVGGYQRFDVFDLRVKRERLDAGRSFEDGLRSMTNAGESERADEAKVSGEKARTEEHAESPGLHLRRQSEFNVAHGVGGLRMM